MEEISFFLFDVEDPARNRKLCARMMRKLKVIVRGFRKKRLKFT